MTEVLVKIIPLDLAATLSPGILALTIILLGGEIQPKARSFSFLFGTLIIAIAIAILGFVLGKVATPGIEPTTVSAVIDLIFGLFFLFYGMKILLAKEILIKAEEGRGFHFFKWFVVGIIVSVTNFDAVLLSFAAAKEVGDAVVGDPDKIILLIVNIFFFVLPTTLPIALYLLFPKFAVGVLEKINQVVIKYSRYILFVMFVIFAIYFLYKGIGFFL